MGGDETNFEGCISLGPWGGPKGKKWNYMPKGFINKISIAHGGVIDSISDSTSFFGGKGGNRTDTICIDYPKEYLTSISGTVGSYGGHEVVMSLCFVTNQNRYGPYGSDTGTRFSYNGKGGIIVGFHGRVGKYLDAVGIYVMPKSFALARYSAAFKDNSTHEFCSRMAMSREAGPWGGSGGRGGPTLPKGGSRAPAPLRFVRGKPWDDGVFSTVKKVHVHVEGVLNVITAVQFEYVKKDAKTVLSPIHGGGSPRCATKRLVNLDGRDEYLTGISGFYGPVEGYDGVEAITSIAFHTNKGIHGPYGRETGAGYVHFTSTSSPGKAVGFYGRKWNA